MNVFGAVALGALLLDYFLGLVADLLNLGALRSEVPEELRGVYDEERYRRSQEYTRARTRFGFVPATFDLVLLLAFWFLGGFGWLDEVARGDGRGEVVAGLIFIGALVIGKSVLSLPFAWYSTFVIEERFGFNKTTVRTFWTDRLKGLVLSVLLGGPLIALILWLFGQAGDAAWLYCWLATTVFSLVVQFVAPTWILPLFNKFEPLEEGELRKAVLDYAQRVGFPLEGLFVLDGSRRSTKANAFFTGFGSRKRVALFDTLIENHSVDELVAIVAHEVGHYKRRHIVQGTVLGILQMGVVFFLLSLMLPHPGVFEAFGVGEPSVYAGLVFFSLLYAPIEMVLSFVVQALSRRNEFQADRFARETTGSGEHLVTALRRLSAENLANLTPHPLYVFLHYSHPPLLQRIAALRG